jgi:hypothetical protein
VTTAASLSAAMLGDRFSHAIPEHKTDSRCCEHHSCHDFHVTTLNAVPRIL